MKSVSKEISLYRGRDLGPGLKDKSFNRGINMFKDKYEWKIVLASETFPWFHNVKVLSEDGGVM